MRIEGSWGEFEAPYVIAFLISNNPGIRKPIEFFDNLIHSNFQDSHDSRCP